MFSQENGYWDTNAIQSQVINLSREETKVVTITLPKGISKFSYKIKIISQYATTAYDFADMFSNSNDPKFRIMSQGAKIAVSSTDPKIWYSIENISGNQKNFCCSSNGIITGTQINYFDYSNKSCINIDEISNTLIFKFKSYNKFFPLKVVFEYIPYIDNELKRGWSKNLKDKLYNYIINEIKKENNNVSNNQIESAVNCILTNVIKDYTLEQYRSLAGFEVQNYFKKILKTCEN
jgi:hypothetical protein